MREGNPGEEIHSEGEAKRAKFLASIQSRTEILVSSGRMTVEDAAAKLERAALIDPSTLRGDPETDGVTFANSGVNNASAHEGETAENRARGDEFLRLLHTELTRLVEDKKLTEEEADEKRGRAALIDPNTLPEDLQKAAWNFATSGVGGL